MGAGGRVWTKSRGTKQAIFLGMWALTGVAFRGAGIRVLLALSTKASLILCLDSL